MGSDGERVRTFTGHTNWVFALASLGDGRHFVSGSYDKPVIMWTSGGERVRTFTGHTG